MNKTLPLFTSTKDLSSDQLIALSKSQMGSKDAAISFSVALDKSNLLINAVFPANVSITKGCAPGEFFEGLWQDTAFELFLGSTDSEEYVEVNLAPHGAWWYQNFSSYRKATNRNTLKCKSFAQFSPAAWVTSIAIPKVQLNLSTQDKLTINACAVISPNKQFLSWNKMPQGKPDFHLKELRAQPSYN